MKLPDALPATEIESLPPVEEPELSPYKVDLVRPPTTRKVSAPEPPAYSSESAPPATGTLSDRVRAAQAGAELSTQQLAELETEAEAADEPHLWISAARLHALASPVREAAARRALSAQALPYVFPGELDTLMVDVLAAGEKVLPALHVDWIRKLTDWIAPALAQDCNHLGLWFWPVLRSLDPGRLGRPLDRLASANLGPGGKGMVVMYAERLGVNLPSLEASMGPLDERIASLARMAVSQH